MSTRIPDLSEIIEQNDQTEARQEHLDSLRELIGNAYPNKFVRSTLSGGEDTITAILDQEKPDPKAMAVLHAAADRPEPTKISRADLAKFLYDRCIARSAIGDFGNAVMDCEKAVARYEGATTTGEIFRYRQALAEQYRAVGEPTKELQFLLKFAELTGNDGGRFNIYHRIADRYIEMGDLNQAAAYLKKLQDLLVASRGFYTVPGDSRPFSWAANVEQVNADLLAARGQFSEAETSYRRAEGLKRQQQERINVRAGVGFAPPPDQVVQSIDNMIANQGSMKARQGRLAEGEADVRRALLSRLKATGKYNLTTASYIGRLANILTQEGRFSDAEKLFRANIDVLKALGIPTDNSCRVSTGTCAPDQRTQKLSACRAGPMTPPEYIPTSTL